MKITALNAVKITNANDISIKKIEIIPAIANMFTRELNSQHKQPWFTGKIEVIPAIADIFSHM